MVSFLGTGYAISLPSRLKCPEAKMKLPPDVSFHTEQRLMVWRPRGIVDEKLMSHIATFIAGAEATSKTPFNRFTDTTLLDAIDLVTLKEELGRSGDLDEVGGPAYIAALVDGVPRSTNVEHYARIVKEKSTLRNPIFPATELKRISAYRLR